jgi:hypothetical protein
MTIKMGDKVRDVITGFEGIHTGWLQYIHGCKRVLINPPVDKDGKLVDAQWFDEQRVELLESRDIPDVTKGAAKEPGGLDDNPRQEAPRAEAMPRS